MLQSGRTGKYLFYAMGEILLVMIGILLALQVNNWNEDRKSLQLADSYKQRLINDLEKDTFLINELFTTANYTADRIQQYFDFFQGARYTLDQVVDSSLAAISLTPYARYVPVNHTFQEMQSSGKLNLLPEKVRELLIEEFKSFYPEISNAKIVNEVYQFRNDFASYKCGYHKGRPTIKSNINRLYFAGDWVKMDNPTMLMEAAYTSGAIAANHITRPLITTRCPPSYPYPLRSANTIMTPY